MREDGRDVVRRKEAQLGNFVDYLFCSFFQKKVFCREALSRRLLKSCNSELLCIDTYFAP